MFIIAGQVLIYQDLAQPSLGKQQGLIVIINTYSLLRKLLDFGVAYLMRKSGVNILMPTRPPNYNLTVVSLEPFSMLKSFFISRIMSCLFFSVIVDEIFGK